MQEVFVTDMYIYLFQGKHIMQVACGSAHTLALASRSQSINQHNNEVRSDFYIYIIIGVFCTNLVFIKESSSSQSQAPSLPSHTPLEYDLVADLAPPKVLHARLVALHAFSEQLCPLLAMFPCQSRSTSSNGVGEEYGLDRYKALLLIYSAS